MRRFPDRVLLIGAAAFAIAVFVFGMSVGRALLGGPAAPFTAGVPGGVSDGPGVAEAAPEPARLEPPPAREVLRLAAEQAPFDPERLPPRERYRLPGDEPPVVAPPPELPPPPAFRLLGAIAAESGGVAVVALEDGTPRVLALGERLGGYTLAAIEADRVVMESGARTASVGLAEPDPTGVDPIVSQFRVSGTGNRARGDASPESLRALSQRLEEMVRTIRERTGQEVRIHEEEGRVYIVHPDGRRQQVGGIPPRMTTQPARGNTNLRPTRTVRPPGGGDR